MPMRHFFPNAETTRGITVRVAPRYLPEQSDPQAPRFVVERTTVRHSRTMARWRCSCSAATG